MIIQDSTATIIDYKTHPYANAANIANIAQNYMSQMQLYQKGVKLLWPSYTVKSVLLFTATSEEYICR
jgi:ATP-dependent exoDNAse (exonuclease V) beta subunit